MIYDFNDDTESHFPNPLPSVVALELNADKANVNSPCLFSASAQSLRSSTPFIFLGIKPYDLSAIFDWKPDPNRYRGQAARASQRGRREVLTGRVVSPRENRDAITGNCKCRYSVLILPEISHNSPDNSPNNSPFAYEVKFVD